jgi:hypothetical protein
VGRKSDGDERCTGGKVCLEGVFALVDEAGSGEEFMLREPCEDCDCI